MRDCMAKKELHGQAAVEALIYFGFFMFISVFVALLLIGQQGQDLSQQRYRLGQNTAGQIKDALDFAALAGPGFNGTFAIPSEIMGRPYYVNITSTGSVYVTIPSGGPAPDANFYYPLGRGNIYPHPDFIGSGGAGQQTFQGSNVRIMWFNTSKGFMRVEVEADPAGGSKILVG